MDIQQALLLLRADLQTSFSTAPEMHPCGQVHDSAAWDYGEKDYDVVGCDVCDGNIQRQQSWLRDVDLARRRLHTFSMSDGSAEMLIHVYADVVGVK